MADMATKVLPWVRLIHTLLLVGARLHGNDIVLGPPDYGDGDHHGDAKGGGKGAGVPYSERGFRGGHGAGGNAIGGDGRCDTY
jgi:hypothetical protein